MPYAIIPQQFLNNLFEMPINIDKAKGKEEILEKAQGIGRRMAIMVEKLYFVEGFDLLKRGQAAKVVLYPDSQNLPR